MSAVPVAAPLHHMSVCEDNHRPAELDVAGTSKILCSNNVAERGKPTMTTCEPWLPGAVNVGHLEPSCSDAFRAAAGRSARPTRNAKVEMPIW